MDPTYPTEPYVVRLADGGQLQVQANQAGVQLTYVPPQTPGNPVPMQVSETENMHALLHGLELATEEAQQRYGALT